MSSLFLLNTKNTHGEYIWGQCENMRVFVGNVNKVVCGENILAVWTWAQKLEDIWVPDGKGWRISFHVLLQ